MPSEHSRRTVLQAGTVMVGTLVAGCTSTTTSRPTQTTTDSSQTTVQTATPFDDSGTFATTPDGPKSYPDRPNGLTRENVSAYVQAFEYARVYNSLHESDAETVSVDCMSVYDTSAQGGHYALATCTGYANYADGVHADHGQLPAVYFVSDGLTVRVEDLDHRYRSYKDVFSSEESSDNVEVPGEGSSAGYRVYNMDTVEHTLSVTVDFLGGVTPVEAFTTEYTIAPTSGVLQESVTYRRGEYRITAQLATGHQTTARWKVTDHGDYGQLETSIIVDPAGELAIREPSFDKLD